MNTIFEYILLGGLTHNSPNQTPFQKILNTIFYLAIFLFFAWYIKKVRKEEELIKEKTIFTKKLSVAENSATRIIIYSLFGIVIGFLFFTFIYPTTHINNLFDILKIPSYVLLFPIPWVIVSLISEILVFIAVIVYVLEKKKDIKHITSIYITSVLVSIPIIMVIMILSFFFCNCVPAI